MNLLRMFVIYLTNRMNYAYSNNNIKFPDGTGFYPDEKDGVRGYNTEAARGADTFHPFKGKLSRIDETFSMSIPKGITHAIFIWCWASNRSPGYPRFSGSGFVKLNSTKNLYGTLIVNVTTFGIYVCDLDVKEGNLTFTVDPGEGTNAYHYTLIF